MTSGEYVRGETPLFSGYDEPTPPRYWFMHDDEDLPEDEQFALSEELHSQIQIAAHGLEQLGVQPFYDYRDIEIHYYLTAIEP